MWNIWNNELYIWYKNISLVKFNISFQRGNPLLKYITRVPFEFDDRMLADYVMGQTTCALYLSVRYHNLNPNYIHDRLKLLGKNYLLRVLLVMVKVYIKYEVL